MRWFATNRQPVVLLSSAVTNVRNFDSSFRCLLQREAPRRPGPRRGPRNHCVFQPRRSTDSWQVLCYWTCCKSRRPSVSRQIFITSPRAARARLITNEMLERPVRCRPATLCSSVRPPGRSGAITATSCWRRRKKRVGGGGKITGDRRTEITAGDTRRYDQWHAWHVCVRPKPASGQTLCSVGVACDCTYVLHRVECSLLWPLSLHWQQTKACIAFLPMFSLCFYGPTFPASIDRQSFSKFCHLMLI